MMDGFEHLLCQQSRRFVYVGIHRGLAERRERSVGCRGIQLFPAATEREELLV